MIGAIEHLTLAREGEQESGDTVVVRPFAAGVLLGVVDALGHGKGAAAVARSASTYLMTAPLAGGIAPLEVEAIIEGLHQHLRGSRGAAAMICLLQEERLSACGVGNVELRALKTKVPVILTPGILGASLRKLRSFSAQILPGDRLVIYTDGLSSRVDLDICQGLSAREACHLLMDRYRRTHDDSTVLVTDFEP